MAKKEVWGPLVWHLLHASTLNYTVERKDIYKSFYDITFKLLPCQECVRHSQEYMNNNNFDNAFSSKDMLQQWFIQFHNAVNIRLNKPLFKQEIVSPEPEPKPDAKITAASEVLVTIALSTRTYRLMYRQYIFAYQSIFPV
jgi:hypothetical protein